MEDDERYLLLRKYDTQQLEMKVLSHDQDVYTVELFYNGKLITDPIIEARQKKLQAKQPVVFTRPTPTPTPTPMVNGSKFQSIECSDRLIRWLQMLLILRSFRPHQHNHHHWWANRWQPSLQRPRSMVSMKRIWVIWSKSNVVKIGYLNKSLRPSTQLMRFLLNLSSVHQSNQWFRSFKTILTLRYL